MFEQFGQRCLGWLEIVANESRDDRGTCTFTDKDGDNIFTTYTGKGDARVERGNYEVVGGTGKFTGITGAGDFNFQPNNPIKADDKAGRGVVSNKINWKLP